MLSPARSSLLATPQSKRDDKLDKHIDSLNHEFHLGIPNPKVHSPGSRPAQKEDDCHKWLKELYWRDHEAFERGLISFRDELRADITEAESNRWVHKPRQDTGTIPSRDHFVQTDNHRLISETERQRRVKVLWETLRSEIWLLHEGDDPQYSSGTLSHPRNLANGPARPSDNGGERAANAITSQAKRKSNPEEQVFYTAPNSPTLRTEGSYPSLGNLDEYDGPKEEDFLLIESTMEITNGLDLDDQTARKLRKRQSKITEHMSVSKSDRTSESKFLHQDLEQANTVTPGTSFATTIDSVFGRSNCNAGLSFNTDVTEPLDDVHTQADSVDEAMQSAEASMLLKSFEKKNDSLPFGVHQECTAADSNLLRMLVEQGPFSKKKSFSDKIPLRAKYELERVRLEWGVDHQSVLKGEKPYEEHAKFWKWLGDLSKKLNKGLPEKSLAMAWDAAINRFQGDRHSEAVVFSGALDWCDRNEPGIYKLRLNPLKLERTCRFHRRFGSDRFLSLTIPAATCAPEHIQETEVSLREATAKWLSNHDQFFIGRVWRAFFIEEYKNKSKTKEKAEKNKPRFRVDFFAVDGVDFFKKLSAPALSPPEEKSEMHTRMSIEQLLKWHIPVHENSEQKDCKLFSRIRLGLSKTWATVVLRPSQIRKPQEVEPPEPVMNDGCALMSRPLARAICENLGIDGNTPSCFQGRIAGAKGLWMVHTEVDSERGEGGFWIEITGSQLKINPHPRDFNSDEDKDKLVFEVADWSKPLRSSELNTQMLEVLDNRGQLKNRVAELARVAIKDIYVDFKTVVEKDSIPLARALIQKIRPTPEDGSSRNTIRRLDQWIMKDNEAIIRFLEAGFSPRNFTHLRKRLQRCLSDTLNRYVNESHVPVPMSTSAFCIADPYGVLEEDEVHFGFSSQWKDCPDFEDAIVDGVDILVGRNPAHCPWDIQRRRAVWKQELRHFKDVIVFSTKGNRPLASLLSGGDYDGDRPWICWDPLLVESFVNAMPSGDILDTKFFGLVEHARKMSEIKSTEDFLEGAFKFNLTTSYLGMCTGEHLRIAYEEPNGIQSPMALELASLLSHLVDSRKSGVQLTEDNWKQYRKKISPRQRPIPAYKNTDAKQGNPRNINDFIRFNVAAAEREKALGKFHELCKSIGEEMRDTDLTQPWQTAWARAEQEKDNGNPSLFRELNSIEEQIGSVRKKWLTSCKQNTPMPVRVQLVLEQYKQIRPPDLQHPVGHTWRNSNYEWETLLASGAYYSHWRTSFPLYVAGETLCRIKTGERPARLIRDCVYVSMRVNSKVARRLADERADDAPTDESEYSDISDEFDGESVIEALLSAGQ